MILKKQWLAGLSVLGIAMLSTAAQASDKYYDVSITNLTRAQVFTPVLVSSHRHGVSVFEAGQAASDELSALAEGGDVAPLTAVLGSNPNVSDVQNSGGLLMPGKTVTVRVSAARAKYISLASMLIPTNDSFVGLASVKAPKEHSVTYYAPAYDAGTEPNDELCVSIPGPVCGGEGGSPGTGGEGYVHISGGINGIGDLSVSPYDWKNPVAKITITRVEQ